MHPELTAQLAHARRDDLHRNAEAHRRARSARRATGPGLIARLYGWWSRRPGRHLPKGEAALQPPG